MSRVGLCTAALALLASCRAEVPQAEPLRYPCDHETSPPEACAEGWRCGFDDFCFPADAGRPVECSADRQCADGWRCGKDRRCHDRSVAAAYPCATPEDCEGGWHCGVAGSCYPRDAGARVACRDELDCAEGWRCGLEKTCHDRAVGADYLCLADSDCEEDFRCGADGRCADAPRLGLPASFGVPALSGERLNPALWSGPPDRAAFHREGGGHFYAALLAEGTLHRVGWSVTQGAFGLESLPWPDPTDDLLLFGGDAYALGGGVLRRVRFERDGGPSVTPLADVPGARRIRFADDDGAAALAWTGTSLFQVDLADGGLTELPTPGGDGGFGTGVTDVAAVVPELVSGRVFPGCLIGASDAGLFIAPKTDGGEFLQRDGDGGSAPDWVPWTLPQTDAGERLVPISFALNAGKGNSTTVLALLAEVEGNPDAGPRLVTFVPCVPLVNGTGCAAPFTCGEGWPGTHHLGPCEPCAPGETLRTYLPERAGTDGRAYTRCESPLPDGGTRLVNRFLSRDCRFFTAGTGRIIHSLERMTWDPGHTSGYVGTHGEVWAVGRQGWQDKNDGVALVLDRQPVVAVGEGAELRVRLGNLANTQSLIAARTPLGLSVRTARQAERILSASAPGRPSVVATCADGGQSAPCAPEVFDLSSRRADGGFTILAKAAYTAFTRDAFHVGARARGDGGLWIALSTNDGLWAGAADAPEAPLSPLGLPLAGLAISGVVVTAPPADAGVDGPFGFVLHGGAVSAFDATTGVARFAPVVLPAGTPAKLLGDDDRALVVFKDGRVLSLPDRFSLAAPLAAGPVIDSSLHCGRLYALAPPGLFQLSVSDAGSEGAWAPVAVSGRHPFDEPLDGGILHSTRSGLIVIGPFGRSAALTGADGGCP